MRRKLEVTLAGKWYIALTVGLGVAAIVSGNNVLYLIESILLSGMILSGVISERAIKSIQVLVSRSSATAKSEIQDTLVVTNRSKQTLFCIEILEWHGKSVESLSFIPRIAPGQTLRLPSEQKLMKRGVHRWMGLSVATSFPFGFARKLRLIDSPGERLVWPEKSIEDLRVAANAIKHERLSSAGDFAEGEVRAAAPDADPRTIIWTMSGRALEEYARVRKLDLSSPQILLDRRQNVSKEEFESNVKKAASNFYLRNDTNYDRVLIIRGAQGTERYRGKRAALNALATVQLEKQLAEGQSA